MENNYLGNPNLKRANVSVEWTEKQVKEYAQCMKDPMYFIQNYVKIISLDDGLIPFKMYDFQKEIIHKVTGALITDQYGISEGCANASKCQYGNYHEDSEFSYLECIDKVQHNDGSYTGKIIATSLALSPFPFIRYQTGDNATWAPDNFRCPCGRESRVILDIVIINNEILVNYINVNDASNNNIIDKYDVVFQDQGILFNHNNFSSNIRALLDTEYQKNNKLISVNSASLDSKNYNLENVMSLHSVLKKYLPSTLSSESEKNLQMKGLDGQLEMYFPPTITTAKSPQFCDKYLNGWTSNAVNIPGSESCIFDHKNWKSRKR